MHFQKPACLFLLSALLGTSFALAQTMPQNLTVPQQAPVLLSPKEGFRSAIVDDGIDIRQIVPLRNFTNAQVRQTIDVTTQLLVAKLQELQKTGVLPQKIGLEAMQGLRSSRASFQSLIQDIQNQDINRVSRDYDFSYADFMPGAIFVGVGVANLPPAFAQIFARMGKNASSSFTLGIVAVPTMVTQINKVCTAEHPQPQVETYLHLDWDVVVIPHVNLLKDKGVEVKVAAPTTLAYRFTTGFIWGAHATGDLYSASQVAGITVDASGKVGWSKFVSGLLSKLPLPTGFSADVSLINLSMPALFVNTEWGGTMIGADTHLSFGGIIKAKDFFHSFLAAFSPTDLAALSNLEGTTQVKWEPASRRQMIPRTAPSEAPVTVAPNAESEPEVHVSPHLQ
jgi:hypothetical protein